MSSKYKVQSSKFIFFVKPDVLCLIRQLFSLHITHHTLLITIFALLTIACSLATVNAQKRDNLTNEEDQQVRDAQAMDERMEVFVKVIDRRLLA